MFPELTGDQLKVWQVGHQLRRLLIKHDLRTLPCGSNITLYSWRSTSITNRLIGGWSVERVSTAFNTSLVSLSQSYFHEVMTSRLHRFSNHYSDKVHWYDEDIQKTEDIFRAITDRLSDKD